MSEIYLLFLLVTGETGLLQPEAQDGLAADFLDVEDRRKGEFEVGNQTIHPCGPLFNIFPIPRMVSTETTSISTGSGTKMV